MNNPDLSIIILNYKQKDLVLNCVRSIKEKSHGPSYEIIVVDNDSDDGIEEELRSEHPEIRSIQSGENIGMGAGNNLGLKTATGEFVAILNADTALNNNALALMIDYLKNNPKAGLVGPKLINIDGSRQPSCYRFPVWWLPPLSRTFLAKKLLKKQISYYNMEDLDEKKIQPVDWIMGSCLLLRRSLMDEIGGFDKRFFMYYEDTDLCRQICTRGLEVIYLPSAEIIHNHSRHSARGKWYLSPFTNRLARTHIISWIKYFLKWGA